MTLFQTTAIALALAGCGGGSGAPGNANTAASSGTSANPAGPTVLGPGTTMTLGANATVSVPAGTTIAGANGNVINLMGNDSTVNVSAGAVITVPATATGPANNTVTSVASAGPAAPVQTATVSATLVAGSSTLFTPASLDGTGAQATFQSFGGITADADGNVIVADRGMLRKVTPQGVVTTIFTDQMHWWGGLAADAAGNLYAVETSNYALVKLSPAGVQTTLNDRWKTPVTPPDGGNALTVDRAGNVYVADFSGRRIVKFTPDGAMKVLAGSGAKVGADGAGTQASFLGPSAIAVDAAGNLFVNDTDAIRKVAPDGTVSTLAKIPQRTIPVDGPIALDSAGNVYTASEYPGGIIRIDNKGNVTTLPLAGSSAYILAMAIDSKDNLYVGTGWASPYQILKIKF